MNADHVINENDVLCGRGGGTNNNRGNIIFRQMVAGRQSSYVNAGKAEKKLVAKSIVDEIRKRGGRFVKLNELGVLEDIGDIKANEKTCQALREGMDIRTHRKEQDATLQAKHEMHNQIPSTFYPHQNHYFHGQSYYHPYHTHVHPPIYSPPSERNYNRSFPHEHVHCGIQRQGQWPMYNRYERSEESCNCLKSNCLKMYCYCFSNSIFCKSNTCRCKDCYNNPVHMQEINQSRSKPPDANASIPHQDTYCTSNGNMLGNQYLHRSQHESLRANLKFPDASIPMHHQRMPVPVPIIMSYDYPPPHSILPNFPNDGQIVHRVGCKCQKSQCTKRYCECFNAGMNCGRNCQCIDCKNE